MIKINDQNIKKANTELILKIAVPALILLLVVGIWILKSSRKSVIKSTHENPDFDLITTEKLDLEKLKSYNIPILLEFGSESCPPCRVMAPVIEELNIELSGKVIVKYIDVWAKPEFGEGYPLTVIPTQLFIDSEGNPYSPSNAEELQMNFYSSKDNGEHIFTTHEGIISKETLIEIFKEMGMKE